MRHRILAIAWKEAIHVRRDPRSMILAVGTPLLMLILFGYAITFDVNHIKMVLCDQDRTQTSRRFADSFLQSGYFDLVAYINAPGGAEKYLKNGDCRLVMIIPPGFSRKLLRGGQSPVQVLVDGSESNTANIAIGYVTRITRSFSAALDLRVLDRSGYGWLRGIPPVDPLPRVWYNPELKSRNFIVPGLIAVIMMIMNTVLTSLTIIREKERGTMEQLIATPVKAYEIITGKTLPYLAIGLIDVLLIVVFGRLVFGVPIKGSVTLLFSTAVLFGLAGLGIGMLVSIVSRSQLFAVQVSMIVSMLPSFLLSGFMIPINSMPDVIRPVAYLVPATYYLVIVRGIFLKGVGVSIVWPQILMLTLLAAALVTLSFLRFKKKIDWY
jgi:ABC-2 type transport system permease protein